MLEPRSLLSATFSPIFGYFLSFSLVFSLASTHSKCTPGSPPILARTQRDVRAAAKREADSRTLKSVAILDKNESARPILLTLRKHREINGPILGQSCEMT